MVKKMVLDVRCGEKKILAPNRSLGMVGDL